MAARLLFTFIVLMPLVAFAATGESHGEGHGVPWKTVGIQAFNFTLLFGLLIYVLRGTVVQHFKQRKQDYQDLVSRAEKAKAEAEAQHREISNRLKELRKSSEENAQKAQSEANALRDRLLKEADELSKKLKNDAISTAQIEIEKAKMEIQHFALSQALETAENQLKKKTSEMDQSKLNSEFIDKIQAVTQ
ncbi:MAG: hypothetical protein CL676_05005 [Bdellovibrionaceae bacterium]|nr:hypothetical protein [Pseudobdellovibrionaceae bacterium]|tara:strand:- start:5968 stop:6540 length:573 start_codon:yes stop_codon:yes gene_type:complete